MTANSGRTTSTGRKNNGGVISAILHWRAPNWYTFIDVVDRRADAS